MEMQITLEMEVSIRNLANEITEQSMFKNMDSYALLAMVYGSLMTQVRLNHLSHYNQWEREKKDSV